MPSSLAGLVSGLAIFAMCQPSGLAAALLLLPGSCRLTSRKLAALTNYGKQKDAFFRNYFSTEISPEMPAKPSGLARDLLLRERLASHCQPASQARHAPSCRQAGPWLPCAARRYIGSTLRLDGACAPPGGRRFFA